MVGDSQDVSLLVGVLIVLTYEFAGARPLATSVIYRLLVRSACTPTYFAVLIAWERS